MPNDHLPPNDPRSWLARAKSDLAIAATRIEGVYLEDLCFHAQQATEKALKGLLFHLGVIPDRIHALAELVDDIEEAGYSVPPCVQDAVVLTDYATGARYPGFGEAVDEDEWEAALRLAKEVVRWVESLLQEQTTSPDQRG